MNTILYPVAKERVQANAVSRTADVIRENENKTLELFLTSSLYNTAKYVQAIRLIFDGYTAIWEKETAFFSNLEDITSHYAYRSIIKLGPFVVPFIIERLRSQNNHWYFALRTLTGQNPVKKEHRGIMPLMRRDWLDWAEKNL